MTWFLYGKNKNLSEKEQQVELVLSEKVQEQKKINKLSSRTHKITDSLSRDRERNHYSERVRTLFGSDRRRADQ